MSKTKLALVLITLSVLTVGWTVPLLGAVHSILEPQRTSSNRTVALDPIRFREDRSAGLLVNGWVNGAGPFSFVVDTGAGVSIITAKVVSKAGLSVSKSQRPLIGGLSSSRIESNQETKATSVSLGSIQNIVPASPVFAIVNSLPVGVDGIIDPSDLFANLAYSIDLPNRQLLVFDAKSNGLNLSRVPKDGAVVKWVRQPGTDRPYVRLGDGRLALIDTGSGFGLAVNQASNHKGSNHALQTVSDLGGGSVQSRSIGPTTVSIGELVLNGVQTDMLIGVPAGTPTILGRQALFPFKITFDPASRLIAFEPTLRD